MSATGGTIAQDI